MRALVGGYDELRRWVVDSSCRNPPRAICVHDASTHLETRSVLTAQATQESLHHRLLTIRIWAQTARLHAWGAACRSSAKLRGQPGHGGQVPRVANQRAPCTDDATRERSSACRTFDMTQCYWRPVKRWRIYYLRPRGLRWKMHVGIADGQSRSIHRILMCHSAAVPWDKSHQRQ